MAKHNLKIFLKVCLVIFQHYEIKGSNSFSVGTFSISIFNILASRRADQNRPIYLLITFHYKSETFSFQLGPQILRHVRPNHNNFRLNGWSENSCANKIQYNIHVPTNIERIPTSELSLNKWTSST